LRSFSFSSLLYSKLNLALFLYAGYSILLGTSSPPLSQSTLASYYAITAGYQTQGQIDLLLKTPTRLSNSVMFLLYLIAVISVNTYIQKLESQVLMATVSQATSQ
jgi:hypothetical protein